MRKRKQAGVCSGLQNRRTAPLVSSVRSTRTRFRQFVFSEIPTAQELSQSENCNEKRG
jgi:hypothetical protein